MKGVKTNTEAVEGSLSDPEVEVRVSLPAPDDVIPGIGAHEDPIEDLFEGLPEGFPEGLREDRPEDLPGDLPEGLPEDLPEDVRSKLSREMTTMMDGMGGVGVISVILTRVGGALKGVGSTGMPATNSGKCVGTSKWGDVSEGTAGTVTTILKISGTGVLQEVLVDLRISEEMRDHRRFAMSRARTS
uniref:Uncharacterized protein n=1 Tax=Amorphochlora amoebiformis TaxID=1561963 RepID=A0A7S0D2U5_9EUKA|mmetsp:Transcript_18106/g.28840  ORF Transcript_18106/g.28840 Transcript_18106/m.28840 type:complete len:187 (+) Transcript_18106:154-714(+)